MKFVICCVRDIKADVFGTPFFLNSLAQAERQFADEVNRPDANNTLYKHPADFELFHIGFFDPSDATFELCQRPQQLAVGSNLVRAVPGDQRQLPLTAVN